MSEHNEIPTPRTEAACWREGATKYSEVVSADFARTLERELWCKDGELAKLRRISAVDIIELQSERDELLASKEKVLATAASFEHWGKERLELLVYLERAGWGPCNAAACNCNGWHKVRSSKDERELEEERDQLRQALNGMLENYIELKRISLLMAKSDAPGWIGQGMTVDDDIHVQKARAALNREKEGANK